MPAVVSSCHFVTAAKRVQLRPIAGEGQVGLDAIIPPVSSTRSVGTTRDRDRQSNRASNRRKLKRKGLRALLCIKQMFNFGYSISRGLNKKWCSLLADSSVCRCSACIWVL